MANSRSVETGVVRASVDHEPGDRSVVLSVPASWTKVAEDRRGSRPVVRPLLVAFLAAVSVVVAVAITGVVTHHPFGDFSRDWRSLAEQAGTHLPFYDASLSILNIIAWAVGGAFALLAGFLIPERRTWFVVFGAFLFLLTADDALTLHENAFGLEVAIYVVYAAVALSLLVGIIRRGIDDSAVALAVGGVFLAVSLVADQLFVAHYLLEDIPKLIGSFIWITVPLLRLRDLRPNARDAHPAVA